MKKNRPLQIGQEITFKYDYYYTDEYEIITGEIFDIWRSDNKKYVNVQCRDEYDTEYGITYEYIELEKLINEAKQFIKGVI